MKTVTHMLIRTDNVPTDLSSEYKIMEGSEKTMREVCDILNGYDNKQDDSPPFLIETIRNSEYFYSVKCINDKLHDGYEYVYGEGINLEGKFEKEKYEITYKGEIYLCNLSSFEARTLFVG